MVAGLLGYWPDAAAPVLRLPDALRDGGRRRAHAAHHDEDLRSASGAFISRPRPRGGL